MSHAVTAKSTGPQGDMARQRRERLLPQVVFVGVSWYFMIILRAGVKSRCADVPTRKMRTSILDIMCGWDG